MLMMFSTVTYSTLTGMHSFQTQLVDNNFDINISELSLKIDA